MHDRMGLRSPPDYNLPISQSDGSTFSSSICAIGPARNCGYSQEEEPHGGHSQAQATYCDTVLVSLHDLP